MAERDREAAERAAVADKAAAPQGGETNDSELALAERARVAAELDAACEEIVTLRKQVPPFLAACFPAADFTTTTVSAAFIRTFPLLLLLLLLLLSLSFATVLEPHRRRLPA